MRNYWDWDIVLIVLVFLLIMGVIVGFVVIGTKDRNVSTSIEDPGTWLKIERSASVNGHRIVVGCDTVTGDRLYIVQSGYVTIVPGGCK